MTKIAVVCIDTQILIWGIQKTASEKRKDYIVVAESLIDDITEKGDRIIIPSIVYAELLAGVPEDRLKEFMRIISSRFPIVPFDALSAYYYSIIFRRKKLIDKDKTQEINPGRANTSADIKVLATAIAHNAITIYSEDQHMHDLSLVSSEFIGVKHMPTPSPKQVFLPVPETDIRQ
ncbi:MAG: PIN domain-containing protein [Desulfovibrio sp.]|jgi:predicted nucleic acid-binding protein|nr:PIN domain-containing protein [Desulfovibrio sp.]